MLLLEIQTKIQYIYVDVKDSSAEEKYNKTEHTSQNKYISILLLASTVNLPAAISKTLVDRSIATGPMQQGFPSSRETADAAAAVAVAAAEIVAFAGDVA